MPSSAFPTLRRSPRGAVFLLVTEFAVRYRRAHGGSGRGFWHQPDAGRGYPTRPQPHLPIVSISRQWTLSAPGTHRRLQLPTDTPQGRSRRTAVLREQSALQFVDPGRGRRPADRDPPTSDGWFGHHVPICRAERGAGKPASLPRLEQRSSRASLIPSPPASALAETTYGSSDCIPANKRTMNRSPSSTRSGSVSLCSFIPRTIFRGTPIPMCSR